MTTANLQCWKNQSKRLASIRECPNRRERFDRSRGDFFVLPPWAWHEHVNSTGEEAILFSIQDAPIMRALSLYREQPYEEHNGHQEVTGTFSG